MTNVNTESRKTPSAETARLLESVEAGIGFVPNIARELAESTPALAAFVDLNGAYGASSFTDAEREVIALATSVENECGYCVAAHSTFAESQGVDCAIVDSIRDERPVADQRLETLRTFTLSLIRKRGAVAQSEIEEFLSAGFDAAQILEVILGISVKTFTNFTSRCLEIPLDEAFGEHAWTPGDRAGRAERAA